MSADGLDGYVMALGIVGGACVGFVVGRWYQLLQGRQLEPEAERMTAFQCIGCGWQWLRDFGRCPQCGGALTEITRPAPS